MCLIIHGVSHRSLQSLERCRRMRRKKCILLLFLLFSFHSHCKSSKSSLKTTAKNTRQAKTASTSRQGKLFSLFNIVQFKNDGCFSTSTISSSTNANSRRNGTCFTTQECVERQGSASGTCAAGFGVCCIFLADSCGSIVTENCTYVRNPGFPSSVTSLSTCTYNIQKSDPEVCSLRLDFESFNLLAGTSTIEETGFACQDEFTVAGLATGQRIPIICGANNGQHIYVDMGRLEGDAASLSFTFGGLTVGAQRLWEIKVLQITCLSYWRPPEGCLQWLFDREGTFQSFNFASGTGHLINQDYSVCIRQELGFCCTKFQPCSLSDSFSLDTNGPVGTVPGTSLVDTLCKGDFIEIEGSASICSLYNSGSRYCGSTLGDTNLATKFVPICDCTPPFVVHIRTDNAKDAVSTRISRGLCLTYTQIPCGSHYP